MRLARDDIGFSPLRRAALAVVQVPTDFNMDSEVHFRSQSNTEPAVYHNRRHSCHFIRRHYTLLTPPPSLKAAFLIAKYPGVELRMQKITGLGTDLCTPESFLPARKNIRGTFTCILTSRPGVYR
mgnify:CR=1 FL=1